MSQAQIIRNLGNRTTLNQVFNNLDLSRA